MTYPTWYGLLLLFLAAYRTWKLIAEDTILEHPRERVIFRIRKRWGRRADYWRLFLECPWCAGFWISLAWWGAFEWSPHWTTIVSVPFAISALVGVLAYFTPSDG